MIAAGIDHVIFDWGDTIMRDDPSRIDAMYLWPKVELVEGVAACLAKLGESHKLLIATSAAASDEVMVRKALARVEVDRYFSAVFTSRITGVPKTDARFWQYLMRALDVRPERLMMVGDGFEGDVLAPSRLGIRAVWFNWRSPENREGENYRTIHRLCELTG